jgi:hypothetical protein
VPTKQRIGRDNRGKLAQPVAPQRPRLLGKPPALGVSEDDAPSTTAVAKHAVFRLQVFDRRHLSDAFAFAALLIGAGLAGATGLVALTWPNGSKDPVSVVL